jgi:hypothetical protein
MSKYKHFITVLRRPRVFAFACGLLAVQLLLEGYSHSERARSIVTLNGKVRPDAVGVYDARWVLFHMPGSPAATGEPWSRRGFLGAHYQTIPGVCSVVLVHMAWTIVPTAVVVGIGGKKRVGNWLQKRRSASWREQGLCGDCGYDVRASRERCPECGGRLPDNPPLERTAAAV